MRLLPQHFLQLLPKVLTPNWVAQCWTRLPAPPRGPAGVPGRPSACLPAAIHRSPPLTPLSLSGIHLFLNPTAPWGVMLAVRLSGKAHPPRVLKPADRQKSAAALKESAKRWSWMLDTHHSVLAGLSTVTKERPPSVEAAASYSVLLY